MASNSDSHRIETLALDADHAHRLQMTLGRLARRLRAETSGGLTPSRLTCLATVVREGPLRVSELASRDSFNPTALSRLIGHLEELGLLTRAPDPTDRRAVVLAATKKGRRLVDRIGADRAALLTGAVATLDDDEADALLAALPALEALAAALAPGAELPAVTVAAAVERAGRGRS